MYRIEKNGSGWKLVGPVLALDRVLPERKLAFDPRLIESAGCAGCSLQEHPICPGCKAEVCVGMLSDHQQSRAKARLVSWHGCEGVKATELFSERKAAA